MKLVTGEAPSLIVNSEISPSSNVSSRVSDPGGSEFKSSPGSVIDIRILVQQVEHSSKNSLLVHSFHDFHLLKINYTIVTTRVIVRAVRPTVRC